MYNLPEMRPQNAAFWNALQTELERFGVREPPDRLDFERRPVPSEIESDTLFTQVCGYPLQTIYRGQDQTSVESPAMKSTRSGCANQD